MRNKSRATKLSKRKRASETIESSLDPIEDGVPASWRDLQDRVAQILREAGVATAVEKVIKTARGTVEVDVWAHDSAATPPQTYILECKRWGSNIPQNTVHAFRTVVGDSGANWGAIVCARGFQKGARTGAEYSNIRLLSWTEFQTLFVERWLAKYFVPEIGDGTDPLNEYIEPINSRIFRKADLLPDNKRAKFRRLRERHFAIGWLCMLVQVQQLGGLKMILGPDHVGFMPRLPLRDTLHHQLATHKISLPNTILDATSYRSLLRSILDEARIAITEFDSVFGERA